MSKLIDNYKLVLEGKLSKSEFLRQARQGLPGYINQFTSYNDAIQIFRTKGILTEDVEYMCKGDRFPLESIERGIDCELEEMGINSSLDTPGEGDYKAAKKKAIDNLCKDPLYYIKKTACCCDKCKHTQEEAEKKKGQDYKQKKVEGKMQKVKPGQAKLQEAQAPRNVQADEDNKTAEKLFMYFLSNRKTVDPTTKSWKEKRSPQQILDSVHKKFPNYRPGKDLLRSFNLSWMDGELVDSPYSKTGVTSARRNARGEVHEVADRVDPRRNTERVKPKREKMEADPDFKTAETLFLHLLNTRYGKATGGVNRSPATILAAVQKKFPNYFPSKTLMKNKGLTKLDLTLAGDRNKLLRESLTKAITKVLSEAATQNLAQLSDDNASVQELPGILNNLENIVTEIESFIIKEQSKIQSVLDSIGTIKNQDNIPIGYKFAQPIMDAFKKDLEPVLQKVDLENLKMPEAPEEDTSSLETNPEGLEPEMEPKQTMFTPKGKKPQLAESGYHYAEQYPVENASEIKNIASKLKIGETTPTEIPVKVRVWKPGWQPNWTVKIRRAKEDGYNVIHKGRIFSDVPLEDLVDTVVWAVIKTNTTLLESKQSNRRYTK